MRASQQDPVVRMLLEMCQPSLRSGGGAKSYKLDISIENLYGGLCPGTSNQRAASKESVYGAVGRIVEGEIEDVVQKLGREVLDEGRVGKRASEVWLWWSWRGSEGARDGRRRERGAESFGDCGRDVRGQLVFL